RVASHQSMPTQTSNWHFDFLSCPDSRGFGSKCNKVPSAAGRSGARDEVEAFKLSEDHHHVFERRTDGAGEGGDRNDSVAVAVGRQLDKRLQRRAFVEVQDFKVASHCRLW